MSADRVEVDRADLITAVAALRAASNYLDAKGNELASIEVGDLADRARKSLFGPGPDGDEEFWVDPTIVELEARASEIEAEMLENIARTTAKYEIEHGRAAVLRAMAPRYRERGTIDLLFREREPDGEAS